MNYAELLDYFYEKMLNDNKFGQKSVTVYDRTTGECHSCDTIEFETSDEESNTNDVFITIET